MQKLQAGEQKPPAIPSRSQLLQLRKGIELAEVLREGHGDADSRVVAIRRHPDRTRPVLAARGGTVGENILFPVLVFQHRLPAVQRHRVCAPEVPIVADFVLVTVEFLAHFGEPQGHVVAVLADALGLWRRAAGARQVEVLVEAVAVVLVFVDGAVDVSAAALAP